MKLFSKNFQKRIADQKILRSKKFTWFAVLFACIGFLLLCLSAFHIKEQTQLTNEKERAKLANKNEIFFEKIPHQPQFNKTEFGISQKILSEIDVPTFSSLEALNRFTKESLNEIIWKKPENITNSRLFFNNKKVWFVGTWGIWQTSAEIST